jgi:hypothetical protein
MHLSKLLSYLDVAKRHIATDDRYRYYPLYACLMPLLIWGLGSWPFSMDYIYALVGQYWLLIVEENAINAALLLGICLGIVGLMRPTIPAKLLSVGGVWLSAILISLWYDWHPVAWAINETLWYTFDLPARYIEMTTGGDGMAATFLWCIYLALIWVVARPILKRAYVGVEIIESKILKRWPQTQNLAKPVL